MIFHTLAQKAKEKEEVDLSILFWILIWICIIIAFIGLIYPVIPGVLFLIGAFLLYGLFFTFEPFTWVFWTVQGLFVVLLFLSDYVVNYFGVHKVGGSKAGIWGSTIGLILGPFIIPVFGIVIGPFVGALVGEMIFHRASFSQAVKIGLGSVAAFFASVLTKGIIQAIMVVYFFWQIHG